MSERRIDSSPRDAATGEDETFLERWSRRKQAALEARKREEEVPTAEEAEEVESPAEAAPADAAEADTESAAEPEPPGDEDMPPLESIDQGGSVAAFFSPRVSAGLRRAALRRLFAQPEINALPAMDDYAEDFSKYKPLGSIITADMRHQAEVAARRAAEKLARRLEAAAGESPELAMEEDSAVAAAAVESSTAETDEDAHPARRSADRADPPAAAGKDTDNKDDDKDDERRPA